MLEYDWLLTALIYGLIGCFRSKLSDLTCPITNVCNRTVKQQIKIKHFMPLASKLEKKKKKLSGILPLYFQQYENLTDSPVRDAECKIGFKSGIASGQQDGWSTTREWQIIDSNI